ncbi:BREX system P-loop protein BrxC [Enterococcus sp. AZ007]|uniref:BREX system P-loop protein BrxC n=1 Tax=Enterococcus sp. AZ007 TaxID=2774839 RepID=UPI003F1EDE44
MLIKDIFAKPIDRNIQGVIKVGQAKDENVQQELEEYVVTKELQKHFKTIFDAYQRSINTPTDKMGVWIQGFFGSGKSHFLKIISYLLANREVNGKKAIDYFKEDGKIKDPLTLATMERCTQINTDVILFNIDSKSDAGGKKDKNGIVNVFLKVFNEMQGLSTIPHLADLERRLIKEEKFDAFKAAFKEINGSEWEAERHEFDWIQDDIKEVTLKIDFMSESAIDNFLEKASGDYLISISDFAELVKKYLDSKESDHHIAFLVDEVGQYVGGNRELTLQLQTVVEDLGRICEGRAWVLVTSQEAIDHVTNFENNSDNDFSKIKDRFATTVSLSSANADEVIKERILKKKESANNSLALQFETVQTELKNKLLFVDSPELKLFKNAGNFAEVYPFIPYQFNLLGQILTEIRNHSYQGSNLSSGERSLLAMFKEAAERNKENDTTALVSLDQFYYSLERWIDTAISRVISQALNNSHIQRPTDSDEFNVNVLRVLFMIKYVDQAIKPNVENITSLMIRDIEEDRLATKKRVEEALELLIKENYVRKNLDSYIFQTDEEQEITREIRNQNISDTDLVVELSKRIFDGVLDRNSFAYEKLGMAGGNKFKNRYTFTYAQVLDQRPYKQAGNSEMTVNFISPYSDLAGQDAEIALKSSRNLLFVELPTDKEFKDDLAMYARMNLYLTTTYSSVVKNFDAIRSEKSGELQELSASLNNQLGELLKSAKFFYNGSEIQLAGSDFKAKFQTALQKMAEEVYHKLSQIDAPKEKDDIFHLVKESKNEIIEDPSNEQAVQEIFNFINDQKRNHLTITMKTIRDRFENKQPYGFTELDVEWCIAKLFMSGKIDLLYNNVRLSRMDDPNNIVATIQKRRESEKIKIEPSAVISTKAKKLVDEIGRELFQSRNIVDENNNERTMESFKSHVEDQLAKLRSYFDFQTKYTYPSAYEYEQIKKYLEVITQTKNVEDFFSTVKKYRDELFDWSETYEKINGFHKQDSTQKKIWENAQDKIRLIEKSRRQISSTEIDQLIGEMKSILKKADPYSDMMKLNKLIQEFNEQYNKLLEVQSQQILDRLAEEKQATFNLLEGKDFKDQFVPKVDRAFKELKERIEQANTVEDLVFLSLNVDEQYSIFNQQFDQEENRRHLEEQARKQIEAANMIREDSENEFGTVKKAEDKPKPVPQVKKRTVPLRTLNIHAKTIKSPEDIDDLTAEINQKLKEQLQENIEITIQF